MSVTVDNNQVVTIHYTLTDPDGEVIDSSEGSEPMAYLHGAGNIIPGLEQALTGESAGAKLQVVVNPEQGYGEYEPTLVETVPLSAFEGVDHIEPGMAFEAQGSDGQLRRIEVREVDDDQAVIDGNHPLAGVELHFEVEVVDVRPASEEEIAHGHVH